MNKSAGGASSQKVDRLAFINFTTILGRQLLLEAKLLAAMEMRMQFPQVENYIGFE